MSSSSSSISSVCLSHDDDGVAYNSPIKRPSALGATTPWSVTNAWRTLGSSSDASRDSMFSSAAAFCPFRRRRCRRRRRFGTINSLAGCKIASTSRPMRELLAWKCFKISAGFPFRSANDDVGGFLTAVTLKPGAKATTGTLNFPHA